MKFVPERLEVAAGDRITWTNRDFVPHSVTGKAAGIESGDLAESKSWTLVPRTP
jgi:plastocyanin